MSFDRRYFSRQIVLSGFGVAAQKRVSRSSALVVGLGGTGCVVATNLALAGVGRLVLVDRDVVSKENLHRQPIYSTGDVGMSKAEAAAVFLRSRAPGLKADYQAVNLEEQNVARLVEGVDVAVDCLDNIEGRYALNEGCVGAQIPMVHTGALGWEASVGVFWSPIAPCFECVFPRLGDGTIQASTGCESVGVLGSTTSIAGSIGALEATKLAAGLDSTLLGKLLICDARRLDFHRVPLEKQGGCPACGLRRVQSERKGLRQTTTIELCGDREFYIPRAFPRRSFARLSRRFEAAAVRRGDSIVQMNIGVSEVSLFRGGGVLVKGPSSSEEAREIIRSLDL